MSIVGTRPPLISETNLYEPRHKARLAEKILYRCVMNMMWWAVPCFLMMTGSLLLDSNRKVPLKKLYRKYILRMLLVLLIFGGAFSWMELFFDSRILELRQILQVAYNVLTGNTWLTFAVCVFYNLSEQLYFLDSSHVVEGYQSHTNFLFCSVFFCAGGLIYLYRNEFMVYVKKYRYGYLLVILLMTIASFYAWPQISGLVEPFVCLIVFSL